jgi:hypothetical protein
MERLFSPCTRLYDSLESQADRDTFRYIRFREVNLDVSTEVLLSAKRAFKYVDLHAMLSKRKIIAWLTPHAAVVSGYVRDRLRNLYLPGFHSFQVSVNGKEIHAFVLTPSSVAFSEIVDVVRRLLLADVRKVYELDFQYSRQSLDSFFSAASLAYLMEQCQSLKALKLERVFLELDHFRVLGDFSKPGLEIELTDCHITGAAVVLAEVLGGNQGPTKLDGCYMNSSVFATGLRGNSRLKSLKPCICDSTPPGYGNREFLAIAAGLKENKGLVELDFMLDFGEVSDETWYAVCDSLKTHPTLEVLDLGHRSRDPLAPAVITSRIQALVDMLRVNMSIHTIHLDECYSEHKLFRGSVIPCLETNRLRLRVLAIQKSRPDSYRAKVLGRALLAARTDVNSFWMLLSGNAEVALPSTTATTTTTTPASSTTGAWCFCWW